MRICYTKAFAQLFSKSAYSFLKQYTLVFAVNDSYVGVELENRSGNEGSDRSEEGFIENILFLSAVLLERGLQPVLGPLPAPGAEEDLWVIPEPH